MALNERQKKFCEFYAKSGNAVQAYKDAGYAVKSDGGARASSSKLLTNPNIALFLANITEKTRTSAIATITDIKEFWTTVLESSEEEMPHRLKASELLVKSSGGFIDKVEHSGELKVSKVERVIIDSKD